MSHYGKDIEIGEGSVIQQNVHIGDRTQIGSGTVIQYGAYIENDCVIGKNSRIGTNAVIRRETRIGDNSVFGSLSASEGKNWIGNNVLIHTQCHLTTGLIVEDWVFIAPMFSSSNDPDMLHGRRHVKKFVPQAAHVKFGARIAVGVTLTPLVVVGREAVVGAGSVVTQSVPDFSKSYGIPARIIGKVEEEYRLPESRYDEFRSRIPESWLEKFMADMLAEF